ncbi:glycosyltransferase [Ferroacidibacillus organovorans]|uniref:Glycosyl transferase family 1 n=1 Tax=Ferroacidibacillus organovorans TaxID=1765683 RepID=A0A853KAE1_9BACL|nr:glycosyltransferase [Ferroacidibacillus organovorans]KYP79844.1 hypothetical protein AYJ22_13300 [Ferroacidibacillus organovorans]OAG93431.1 hypothetical protein AYW79_10620 [Ferroacidibacillus organovorans]
MIKRGTYLGGAVNAVKVAIVHEWLVNFRGSEKVLLELSRIFPDATIYVSVLDRSQLPEELAAREIRTTFLQHLPFSIPRYQAYLLLMPLAYSLLDMKEYDLIITSSHACANGVRARRGALHISYCYTPMRYAWSGYQEYYESLRSPIAKAAMTVLMAFMRFWDYHNSQKVDHYIACSRAVAERIEKYYGRSSVVIYPPVGLIPTEPIGSIKSLLPDLQREPYYLSLGRLVPYKRVDLAIKACERMQRHLVVAGNGPELERLQAESSPWIHFITAFSDEDAKALYKHCSGFIFPGEEDFGLTVVEVQRYGKPVVAYAKGGAEDTVIHGKTGILFQEQSVDALVDALIELEQSAYDVEFIRDHSTQFSPEMFHAEIRDAINMRVE